jgi:hypothetical protein
MNKVIVTLTTIPDRLHDTKYGEHGIYSGLLTLLNQDCVDYEVHFNIPYTYHMTGEEYIIPSWLEDLQHQYSHLKIFRMNDEGPLTKILPTIKRISNPDTIIVVADDDQRYQPNMVTTHIKNQQLYEKAAVGYDGLDVLVPFFHDPRDHYVSLIPKDLRVKVLQHYKTVSYKRSYFDDDLFTEFVGKTPSDDILISAYLGYKNIPKIVTFDENDTQPKSLEEWHLLVGKSFPIIGSVHHDTLQGCNHPNFGNKFYAPSEFYSQGYLER